MVDHRKNVALLCWLDQDFEGIIRTQINTRIMKTKSTLLIAVLIGTLFGAGCAIVNKEASKATGFSSTATWGIFQVPPFIGKLGDIEKKTADFKVRLPAGFRETLTQLEDKYHDEWTAFDQNINGCTVYYGWLRGHAIGEYKVKIREDPERNLISIEFIALNRHGVGGMGISEYINIGKRDKKNIFQLPAEIITIILGPKVTYFYSNKEKRASLLHNSITVPLIGKDAWGPFSLKITGEFSNQMMVGSWDVNHGPFGNYTGTLYGIRLDPAKTASASIADQNLYQAMLDFNHVKEVREGSRGQTVTLPTNPSDTTLKSKLRPIVIYVRKGGIYIVRTQEMKLNQIEPLLKEAVQKNPNQKVVVCADSEAQYKHVAAAVDVAKAVGIPKVNIGYQLLD